MARTRVRWGRVLGLTTAIVLPFTAHTAGAAGGDPVTPRHTYVVRAGDTLWSIAERVSGPEADLRPVVDQIVAANGVDGAIVPGQRLRLP